MVQIRSGTKVSCRDGWIGVVRRLVVDPDAGKVTHLVIEMVSSSVEAIVPVEHVIATGYEAIFLDLTSAQLEAYCEPGTFE